MPYTNDPTKQYRRRGDYVFCDGCNKEMYRSPCDVKRGRRSCSKECRLITNHKKRTGQLPSKWKGRLSRAAVVRVPTTKEPCWDFGGLLSIMQPATLPDLSEARAGRVYRMTD